MLALRLPARLEKRLDSLARRTGRTKSFYAREAIVRHMDELEDTYVAIERLEKPTRRWKLEALEQGLDLEG